MKHLLFPLCLLLGGCSQHWISTTKPEAALDKDMEACRQQAFKKFPPNLLPDPQRQMCIPSPKVPSPIGIYGGLSFMDTNRSAREQIFQECMVKSGWHQQGGNTQTKVEKA